MKKGKLYIGTSGWHYKHWKGTFYPADITEAEQFEYYRQHFQTVELNNSFYHLPLASTADTKMFAEGIHPVFRIRMKMNGKSFGPIFFAA